MIDADLIHESNQLRASSSMMAEAKAAGTTSIGHTHPQSAIPPGLRLNDDGSVSRDLSTQERIGRWLDQAIASGSDDRVRAAIDRGNSEIDHERHSPAGGAETPVEFGDRVVRDHEGELAGVVARAEKTSVTTVRKMREQRGCEPRWGRKVKAVAT